MSPLAYQSLVQEKVQRLIARERLTNRAEAYHLLDLVKRVFPQYRAEPAHELIASALEAVVSGDLTRLMIFTPPQHGKSTLTSVHLPGYWLAYRPDDPVILASYAASLAERHSKHAREVVESSFYRALFPGLTTRSESRSAQFWQLNQPFRGSMLAVGVGGPITGFGAMLGIIDDPFENWEQAQSLTYRDRAWDWYRTTFRTRVWERGAIILVCTRWHEDDLAGRLLQSQGAQWTVLRLPALAETQQERDENNKRLGLPEGQPDPLAREPGEPLCPARFSRDALEAIRTDVGALAWAAEYQGVPRAPEGNRIKRAWLPVVDALPVGATSLVRYWDKAATESDGACYTAGVLITRIAGITYIVDVVRGRWTVGEREAIIRQTAYLDQERVESLRHQRDRACRVTTYIEQEPGSGGKESAEATIANLAGFAVYADRPSGNKDVRLEPFAAQAEAGNVRLLRGAWNQEYIEELCTVPNATYRDQADATAGAFNKLTVGRRRPGWEAEIVE